MGCGDGRAKKTKGLSATRRSSAGDPYAQMLSLGTGYLLRPLRGLKRCSEPGNFPSVANATIVDANSNDEVLPP